MANEDKKIGSRFVDAVEDLPGIKQIGAWNARNEEIKAILAERARSGESGIISQGLQGVIDVGGSIIGAPFQAIDKGVGIVSDVTNVDKRLLDAGITTAVTLAGVKGSKTGAYKAGAATRNVGKTLKQRVGNINQPASKQTISVNSSKAYKDLVRDYPTTTNSMGGFVPKASISDFTYGGYLQKYPKGTGMTGAGSGAAYIAQEKAVTDALTGKAPEPGQPYAMAYENVKPSNTAIHSVTGSVDRKALTQQIGDWLGKQKKNFNVKTINKEFGFINDVNKGYQLRIKTTGAEKYLTDIKSPDEAVRKAAIQHIKLEKVTEKNTNRAETQDIGKIDVVTENLDRMNTAWDGTKGIDPEVLNPRILRKVVNQGARLKDKITSELSKRFGISLQKEHVFGIRSREGFGQDAAIAQHAGETGMNNLLSKLTLNNAFSREAGYELGMPTHGYSQEELANMHPRRKAELENLGALEVLTHYGMMSNDPNAFKAEIDSLKDQLKGIKEGDPNIVPTSPGRIVTDADLLKIQQLGHKKGMDRTAAAEMVLAQREALNQLLDAGLEVGPKELEVLKEILTEIEIDTKIRRAKKDTKWQERFPGKSIDEYPQGNVNVYPSAATGKPVPQKSLRLLKEKINKLYFNDPADL